MKSMNVLLATAVLSISASGLVMAAADAKTSVQGTTGSSSVAGVKLTSGRS